MKEFVAYTDGSFDMNDNVGSSSVVILDKEENIVFYHRAKARRVIPAPGGKQQFAQEQELGACIRAAMCVPEGARLTIKTDSQYCAKVLSGEWNASANLGLIDRFDEVRRSRHLRVEFIKVKEHSGNRYNEFADELCATVATSLRTGGSGLVEYGKVPE